ncbi:cathepsin B [Tetranychus urticae]|uniref:Peptidase C1A papain C-terminal domain-containing protein n=1 Tax=Tetranychus urticae TaxID=32264 RepID=T1K0I9_TETUR|nr:cathepsin B [Tetranychus urticae]
MKSLIFLVLSVSLAYGARVFTQRNVHPLSDEMIDRINSIGTTWKAGRNFDEASLPYVKRLLGAKRGSSKKLRQVHHEINEELPESFDARAAWPNCTLIKTIRDQGNCGSGWAFSSVEAMSDRICIASHGELQVSLSAQEIVACSNLGGCDQGLQVAVYIYYATEGIVTGGSYHGDGCMPYDFEPCMHGIEGPIPTCPQSPIPTPSCSKKCAADYEKTFEEDKHYGLTPYVVSSDPKQIMKEIMTNGPISSGITVYADFLNYKSGVYQKTTDHSLGAQGVKIIGWGTENGVDYWLVANSWNEYWGDKGFFKIRRGNNECYIESDIISGLPRL